MKNAHSRLEILQFSQKDVKTGHVKTAQDIFTNLRRKYNLGDQS